MRKLLSVLTLVTVSFSDSLSQSQKEEQVNIYGSIKKPIDIEVINKGDEIQFYAINKSYYPYQLSLSFSILLNLEGSYSYSQNLITGRSRLFSLRIKDKNAPHNYQYNFKYNMGNPKEKADPSFLYLIPLSGNEVTPSQNLGRYIEVSKGDSILASRKGVITSIPDSELEGNRLFKNTLEVLHNDGTVAIFKNIEKRHLMVREGDKVLPGQLLAIIDEQMIFAMYVYQFTGEGRAVSFDYTFVVDDNKVIPSSKLRTSSFKHPTSVIVSELTKREIKQLEKLKTIDKP